MLHQVLVPFPPAEAPPVAAVIGDIVGSRRLPDRAAAHAQLEAALHEVAAQVTIRPPRVTVGDEFQMVCADLAEAVDIAFRVHLRLLPHVDTRFGIGFGPADLLDPAGVIEDGPGWWAARAAIEAAEDEAERAGLEHIRTLVRAAEGAAEGAASPAEVGALCAALRCRDHLVGSLDERSLRILEGLMSGATQLEIADREGISPSAVSQRVRKHGLAVVLAAHTDIVGAR